MTTWTEISSTDELAWLSASPKGHRPRTVDELDAYSGLSYEERLYG